MKIPRVKRKRIVVPLTLTTCVVVFTLVVMSTRPLLLPEKRNGEVFLAKAKFDIFINSYMRSGSSFVGRLLTSHPETFYWYEPLWNLDSGVYYWGKDYICTGYNKCGIARNKTRHNIHRVHSTIESIFTCNLSTLEAAVAEPITVRHSGDAWKNYQTCRKDKGTVRTCLKEMEPSCTKTKHRAVKSVRLTVDNLEHFLDQNANLKVLHLIRDPRAIMNSRITTKWFRIYDSTYGSRKTVGKDAEDLCYRMNYDIREGIKLKKKFPKRFIFIMFEDLLSDLQTNAEILYSFFGIQTSKLDKIVTKMRQETSDGEHSVRHKDQNYSDWWRYHLKSKSLKPIEDVCKDVLNRLGYKLFETFEDRRNNSLNTFKFNDKLLIKNIFRYSMYDSVFDIDVS